MNNYVAMTIVHKGQRENYFSQQGKHVNVLLILPAYISAMQC